MIIVWCVSNQLENHVESLPALFSSMCWGQGEEVLCWLTQKELLFTTNTHMNKQFELSTSGIDLVLATRVRKWSSPLLFAGEFSSRLVIFKASSHKKPTDLLVVAKPYHANPLGHRKRTLLQTCFCVLHCPEDVKIFSEFAGYGTAELAAHATASLLASTGSSVRVESFAADLSPACRRMLIDNGASCVFGDILNLLPAHVRNSAQHEVQQIVELTSLHMRDALPSRLKGVMPHSLAWLITSQGRLKLAAGPVPKDFRIVGLALEDGQLDGHKSWEQVTASLLDLCTQQRGCAKYVVARRRPGKNKKQKNSF